MCLFELAWNDKHTHTPNTYRYTSVNRLIRNYHHRLADTRYCIPIYSARFSYTNLPLRKAFICTETNVPECICE